MKERKSYKGTLNGNFCICTDKKPEGFELQEEVTFYQADEGKIFKKGNEYAEVVFDTIRGWEEVDSPDKVPEEGGKDETTVD